MPVTVHNTLSMGQTLSHNWHNSIQVEEEAGAEPWLTRGRPITKVKTRLTGLKDPLLGLLHRPASGQRRWHKLASTGDGDLKTKLKKKC